MKYIGILLLLCAHASTTSLPIFKHDKIVQAEQGVFIDLPQTAKKTINLQYIPQQVINIKDQTKIHCASCIKTNQPCYLKYVILGAPALELVIQKEKLDRETRLPFAKHNNAYAIKRAIRIYRRANDTTTSTAQWIPILTLPEQENGTTPNIYIHTDGTLHL